MSATEIQTRLAHEPENPEAKPTEPLRIDIPQSATHAESWGETATAKDRALTRALTPQVRQILEESLEENPELVVNIVYPVLGKAIRRAITSALASLVASIEEQASAVLTLRGLRWRWQAYRSGRSYAEIVLANSLVYQVEEVLLIHRPSGILVDNVSAAEGGEDLDRDLVSSMLTALEDFARDSFDLDSDASLDHFSLGDLHVIVKATPLVVVAAAVRGTIPAEVGMILEEIVEEIHRENFRALTRFDGDVDAFPSARSALRRCLVRKPAALSPEPRQ